MAEIELVMAKRRAGYWLAGIIVFAFLARAAVGMVHPFLFPDSDDYVGFARALLRGEYFYKGVWASRMPGYSGFLAGCYWLFGDSNRWALVVQAGFGAGCVGWVYALCDGMPRRVRLVAAGLMAVDPLSVAFSAAVLSETLFTFFLLGSLVCMMRLGRKEGGRKFWWWVLLCGLWVGAIYMRPAVLWCPVGIVGWRMWMGWRERTVDAAEMRRAWKFAAGMGVVYGVTFLSLLPWWGRNYGLFGTGFFRMTTLDGKFLYESFSPQTTGVPAMEKIVMPADMVGLNEGATADEFKRRGWEFAKADPWRQVGMAFVKAGRMWNPLLNAEDYKSPVAQVVLGAWHLAVYGLGLVGVWRVWGRRWEWGVLAMPLVYFAAVHAIYLGSVRYRVPLTPLMLIFAAVGLSWCWQKRKGTEIGKQEGLGGV